jgi:hypothetical protein
MSLLNLVTLAGSLALASLAVAMFALLGRAFWRSRRFSSSGPAEVLQPTPGFATAGNHFVPASGSQR